LVWFLAGAIGLAKSVDREFPEMMVVVVLGVGAVALGIFSFVRAVRQLSQ
jgi:hypothetical protein